MSSRELIVLGTASQVPTRSRNQNGYVLRWDGEALLFDPGEGAQRQMLLAGVKASQITRVCLTHFHGDHCLGLPGVLQRLSIDRAPHVVQACYPADGREFFQRLRHAAIFHDVIRLRELPVGGPGRIMQTPCFCLDCLPLSHSVPTVGYRLIEPDGRRMLPEKLASYGVTGSDIGRLQREGYLIVGGQRITVEQVSEPRRGQRFAFVMDTRLCDAAFALADGADMLVCESTFTEAQAPLARDYGHLTAAQAGRIAAESRVRLLVLTHFSQRYGDNERQRFADEAGAVFNGDIVVAQDLARIPLPHRGPAQRTLPSTAQSID